MNIFLQYIRVKDLRQQKYKHKHLSNTRVLKVKNITLELENDFKPIDISVNNTNKFEKRSNKECNIYKKQLVPLLWMIN